MRVPSWRYIGIAVAAGMAMYLAMIVLSDAGEFVSASKIFDWMYLVPVIALVTANYLIRCERWHIYLSKIGIGLPRKRSYWMFLAGLSMSVTPGKLGEALKGLLLRIEKGVRVERGVGVVFVERITDIVGVIALIAIGAVAFPYGLVSFAVIVCCVACVLGVVTSERLAGGVLRWLKKRPRFAKFGETLEAPLRDTRRLLTGRTLLQGTALAIAAWACEGVAFYLIVVGMDVDIDLLVAIFIYSFASVVGAVSMLPGGMGTTEATMIGLLLMVGTVASTASFVVVIARLSTLWYAVAVGLVFLALFGSTNDRGEGDGREVTV